MPNSNFGNIQYKASNGLIKLDELEGIVECFVSGIGNKDSVGDICATGAFAKSLLRRKPRVVWGHNWNDPIGKVLEIYEVPASDPRLPMKMKMAGIGGLYAKVQFNLQSEKGKEAFANVAFFGEEQEWSIGYKTLRAQYDDNLQANVLYEVELYEVSPVLHGANQLTGTISVKSDEEKMHGMMPLVIGGPGSNAPSRENIFEEGMAQRISGSQLASVVAELSRRAGGPVMVVEATENSVVFVKPGKGKFRIGYHFTGSEYMFGKPELIHADQPKPQMQSGPSPVPGISAKPTVGQKPATTNPAMPMPVAVKPGNGGMVMVPLPQVEYEGMDKNKKPELVAEERELAESLVRIAGKYGKFDEDGDGIWAGYYPPAENKVKDIGVKCSNCVLYQGEGKCKILDLKVEDEGKCRFAIIPDGVVVGFGKKEYNDILDDEEIKMVEDIEAKYPGEFILGVLRNTVKKRRKKRRSYKTLEEWGVEEQELMEKGLDPFLAQDASYVLPVDPANAFEFKSMIDPVLEYHRIDTYVNEYGVVIASQLDQEAKDALETATKAAVRRLGRSIRGAGGGGNFLGRTLRGGRGLGVPSGDLDPRTRRDSNLDGTLFDNIPGWEQPDPTPGGPGSINNPKPSKRQLADAAKPDGTEKLSSGARNIRRHADRSADMEKQFPNAEENQKRADHEAIAKAWQEQGLGWEEVPRYNADKNLSSDYLRGREIGVNQARVMWEGDSVRKRPEKFNEKQKASQEYSNWYSSYAKSVSAYLDAHSRDDSDNWDGIEEALRADVKSKYPDTQDWAKEDIATLNEYLNDIGLLDVDKLKKKKKKKAGAETAKEPDLQELRKLNAEGKLSSGKAARRDLVSGNKVPGEGKFARLIDEQMGNRNDEREPSYVARKYADALVENWRSLSDSERKEFLQDEMGSEYMPKAEEFLEILDEAWATYSQRNKKFKDIDNELQDIMDSSRLSSGGRLGASPDDAEYGRELAAQRARDRAAGRNATNPIGRGGDSGAKKKPAKEKPGLSSGRTRDPNNDGFLRETDYNDPDAGYGLVPRLMKEVGFDEYEARDAMDYWNSLDDDEMKEFEDARNGDVYGAISDAWDESQAAKPSKEKLSSGKKPTNREIEKQEMDAADNSLRSFMDGFDGWDDEEWEFGNQLDAEVERWASANEDMPWINTSVEDMIDEMSSDDSIEGQNKLVFLENLQQSLFDAQDRARMSDDERSRDRLERSVRRSQSDFDEGGILSSGFRRTPAQEARQLGIDTTGMSPKQAAQAVRDYYRDEDQKLRKSYDGVRDRLRPAVSRRFDYFYDTEGVGVISSFDGQEAEADFIRALKDARRIDASLEESKKILSDIAAGGEKRKAALRRFAVSEEERTARFPQRVPRQINTDEQLDEYLKSLYLGKLEQYADDSKIDDEDSNIGETIDFYDEFADEVADSKGITVDELKEQINEDGTLDDYVDSISPESMANLFADTAEQKINDRLKLRDEFDKMGLLDLDPEKAGISEIRRRASSISEGSLSSGANPRASDEIRRIVETNQDIERAALYVGLDEVYEGRTSRAMGARIMADANAGNLPESDGEQLGMAIELIDEFFPDASSRQKRALEQSVFGAIARNARESRVDADWDDSQKLSSGRGKIPPRPSEFAKKIGPYDGKLSVEIMSASNGLDLQINGKKVGRFRSNESLDRFVNEVHVALRNRDGLSSGLKPKPEINIENVKKNIAELEAGGDRAKAVLKKDFRGRRYSDGTQFGSKFLGKDGNSYSTDIEITDEELEAYIRAKYVDEAYKSMKEDVDNMEDVFIGDDDIPDEIRNDLMPYLPFYDEAIAEMQKDPNFENSSSIGYPEDLYEFAPYEDLLFDTAQKQIRIRKRKLDQASTLSSGMRKFDDLDEIDKQQAAKNLASDISRIIGNSNSDPDFDYGFKKFIDDSGDYESGDSVDAIRDNYASFLFEAAEKGDWETLEEHDVDLSTLLEYTPEAHPDVEMEYELDKSDREWADMMSGMRRDLAADGSSEDEVERILDHWLYSSDSPRQEEYLEEYREPGDDHSDTFNRAAKAMYQDHLERLYDNRQERNLSSGKRTPEQESRISDREVFERRMAGESLAETATALGMKREEVRQAELRHMARERGTLQRPDSDEIEAYREDQSRMAAEEAAELALNESIYLRRMDGESLAETAKALGMKREEVRNREQKHMQLMRSMDREAQRWVDSNRNGKLSSGSKGYVSPLDDLSVGQKLSSGKLDEVYRSVQDKLIEQIEKIQESGDGKWEFPWHKTSLPKNVTNNNRPYTGINSVMLMFKQDAMGYDTALWAGFNQWKKLGGTVRKGEKGTMILIPTIIPKKKDADGNEIRGSGGIFFKTGHVFNIDQIDGIDKEQFKVAELPEEQRVAELEQALSEIGAVVNTGGDRAFYRPSTDEIYLPPFSAFKSREGYYAVFAHELMHWTGHSSRLKRDHLGEFGSPEYAQEELIAEIASAFFMAAHGLTPEPREDHAQYLASWLKKLKSDPDAMKKAFGEAQKAHDFAISKSPSMSAKLGKKVAEAGIIPGNDDGGYGDISPSLSSGKRDKYMYNAQGRGLTLAEEVGNPDDEVLKRFYKRRPYFDGDKHYYEASASLGDRGVNQWSMGQADDGLWYADLMFMDGVGEDDEIDWDVSGVSSEGFKTPEEVAKWTFDYEESRREWQKKFRQESDIEKIAEMLAEEEARRDAEYENSKIIARERMDREEYTRIISQIDESRLDWSPEDWADEASDIQAELMRENNRLSSGVRSRYDDKPVEEIGLVTDALQRTDEAGSNSRHIASRLLAVPVDKYDFDSIRRNGEVISFTYNGKPRMVYPTGMMTKKGGGIYFVGLDEESGQYRSFSLHKIEGLIDGAIAPINPTQPGVPQGASFASGRRTRNITSNRLSSGKVRPLDEVREEIEQDARYESLVVQDAFGGRLGTEKKGQFRVTIPLEDHAEAVQSLDRLVALRNDLLRSLLDGKRMPAGSYIFEIDKYAPVAEDELDLLMNIDDAVDRIHDELRRREEQFSELKDEIDDMKDSISELEDAFRTTRRMGARSIPGPVNFESAMERNIDMADGDDKYAIRLIESDADSIIEALEKIDDTEDRFGATHEEQIAEIKELIDSAVRGDLTPQEFASKLADLFYKNVNGLEDELSDLFNIQTQFDDNGVTLDRKDITGTPEDVFSSSNLSNFDMVEGDTAGFSSGRRKRTQGSKRRPMSDADRQAFADGVRQRAATIPGKKRPGPSKDEFDTGKLSSGRLYFPSEIERNKIGNNLEDNVKIKFGRMSENNDRTPDGKWMLDASKLKMLLKDEDGRQLSNEESAKLLGVSMREFEKILQDGAGISESDAYTFIDQAFTGGTNPAGVADIMEAIWGFDAVPYWYDSRRGNLLTRAEYEDYKEEGIQMDGELVPRDFDVVEKTVASEVSKTAFPVSALADSLGVESDKDLADAVTFEVDGEKITPTYAQLAKWKKEGVPTAIIEQLVDRGIIPSAGDVFGEEGVKFDNSIRQFDLWKNVRDAIEKSGRKAKYKDLDEVIGAAKVLTRLRAFEEGREGKFSKNTGKALRYTDEEVNEIVDRLNKKYNLNETIESIKGSGSMSSGRRAARRISNSGQEAVEKLSSGRENNGAPENITPRMQKEIMGWAENATWSNFAKSVVAQFKANGFLSRAQWTRLLQLHDDSQRRR